MNNSDFSAADLAAVVGNNDGFGGNGAWSFWIIILLLFCNGGWGNGYGNNGGGNGCMVPQYMMGMATNDTVQNGFNQMALTNGLTDLTAAINNGFSTAEVSRANTLASITNQMNNIAMNQQQNCYTGQLQIANLGAQIASEACADRQSVNDGVRDLMAQSVANTNQLYNMMNAGFQSIKDQLCDYRDAQKDETIATLRQQVMMKDLAASQASQNDLINQGFANEIDQLYNRLNNCPINTVPVFGKTPIFNCGGTQGFGGCGCGN